MMWLGLVMMVLSGVAIYAYYNKQSAASLTSRNQAALKKAEELRKALPQKDLSIANVNVGGIVRLEGVGLESRDFDLQISARHLCKVGTARWFELEGESGEKKFSLSVEGKEVAVTLEQPNLRELGLNITDLNQLESRQEPIHYHDQPYTLDRAGVATWCENGNELEPENYEYWDFETNDGSGFLSVSRWGDGNVEVGYSVPVRSSQITVYSLS